MQALRLEAPQQFQMIDLPEPAEPGPGSALVRVHRVGICGTDASAYLGKMPFVTYPRILGHELGVEVVTVGPDVTNVRPGDRCSVEPYINDPNSYASRRGRSDFGFSHRHGKPPRHQAPLRPLAFPSSPNLNPLRLRAARLDA